MRLLFDSSVIIIGFERKESNSSLLLGMVFDHRLGRPFLSEKAVEEVKRYFRSRRGERHTFLVGRMLLRNFEVVARSSFAGQIEELRGTIKEKDLEHLAAARKAGATFIVAFDRDFEGVPEHRTPRQLVELLNAKGYESEY